MFLPLHVNSIYHAIEIDLNVGTDSSHEYNTVSQGQRQSSIVCAGTNTAVYRSEV